MTSFLWFQNNIDQAVLWNKCNESYKYADTRQLLSSLSLLSTCKNKANGGIALHLVSMPLRMLRGIELDLKTTFLIRALVLKISQVEVESQI